MPNTNLSDAKKNKRDTLSTRCNLIQTTEQNPLGLLAVSVFGLGGE